MPAVNWVAIVAAALSMFVIGGLWYGPLFAKPWQTAAGLSDEQLKGANMPLIFGLAFVLSLLMAANLAFFVAGVPDLGTVVGYAVAAGLGWALSACRSSPSSNAARSATISSMAAISR